jgi:hypothetical protein
VDWRSAATARRDSPRRNAPVRTNASTRDARSVSFSPGWPVAKPAALALLSAAGGNSTDLLVRHRSGDWHERPADRAKDNDVCVKYDLALPAAIRLTQESVDT